MRHLLGLARSDAARALIELAPTISTVGISRVWRRLSCSPGDAMGHLAEHLLSEIEAGRLDETTQVLAVAERFIRRGRPAYVDVAIVGLLESLHAAASHRSPTTEETLVGLLPDACRTAWGEIREFFDEVAQWLIESEVESTLTVDGLEAITEPDAAAHLRSHYWRSSRGVCVGAADVLAYRRQGGSQ